MESGFDFRAETKEFLENNYIKGIVIEEKAALKAIVTVTTLEDIIIEADWQVSQGGLKVIGIGSEDKTSDSTIYEDLHILLQNLSPAY